MAEPQQYEFLRPIVAGWRQKIAHAVKAKKPFDTIAKQCNQFFSGDVSFMWKKDYMNQYMNGVIAPKFQITIAKAFELVSIIGPVLYWNNPNRQVRSYQPFELTPECLGDPNDPQVMQAYEAAVAEENRERQVDKTRNSLMERWLNYTPREQPFGGLAQASQNAITEAMIKGRGVLWIAPYYMPGSNTALTGCFYDTVDDLYIDPDARDPSLQDAKYIIRRHVTPRYELERRFKLPKDELKGKATLASAESQAERVADEEAKLFIENGQSFDLVVWFEIWSKAGVGGRLSGVVSQLSDKFDELVGDYAYLAIAPSVDYPLNASSKLIRQGATNRAVRNMFQWPFPTWRDDRWPVTLLDFYPKPNSCWPLAPMAMGLGELLFMNVMISMLADRVYSSTRDIWAYFGSQKKNVEEALKGSESPCFIEINEQMNKNINEIIQHVSPAQVPFDSFRMLNVMSEMFDKRTGLTELAYGLHPGAASRTATDINVKAENMSVRPEYMSRRVEAWQREAADVEKFAARWFVESKDVRPLLGRVGAALWQKLITDEDPEVVVREMRATVEANSIRKPNKQRDMANLNETIGWVLPVLKDYAALTGNSDPLNAYFKKYGEAADMDMTGLQMGPWQQAAPPPEMMEQQQAAMQMEQMRQNAELQLKMLDAELKKMELQSKGIETQAGALDAEQDAQRKQLELQFDAVQKAQDLQHEEARHEQQMTHVQELQDIKADHAEEDATLKINVAAELANVKLDTAEHAAEIKQESDEERARLAAEQSRDKATAQAKAAKAKPKPKAKE